MKRTRYTHQSWPAGSLVVRLPTSAMRHFWACLERHREWLQPKTTNHPHIQDQLKGTTNAGITCCYRGTYSPETLAYGGMVTLSFFIDRSRDSTQTRSASSASFSPCCLAASGVGFLFLRWNCFIFVFTNLSYWVNTTTRGTIWSILLYALYARGWTII